MVARATDDALSWMDRCEGFAVYDGHRHIGYVSAVRRAAEPGGLPILVVRRAGRGTLVRADRVERVDPVAARVDLAPPPSR